VKLTGAKPFVTDTVRIQGLDYLEVANQNGPNHLSCGAPLVAGGWTLRQGQHPDQGGAILGRDRRCVGDP